MFIVEPLDSPTTRSALDNS